MTSPGSSPTSVPARHVPVLLGEACEKLGATDGGVFLDGTFGAGGYTAQLLAAHPDNRILAIDRDPDAIVAGAAFVTAAKGRLALVPGRFGELDLIAERAGFDAFDGVVLDIGVSSMQLDQAERGFSFRQDGPLDMRMEQDGLSAADLVNESSENALADIFFHYGEERRSRAVARAIIEERRRRPILTTRQLAELVATIVRAEPHGPHPATRVFQALRIAVNDELGELVQALHAAETILKPGGRLAVVTFHSLEDRIVKLFLANRSGRGGVSRHLPAVQEAPASFTLLSRGPILPSDAEIALNPRARSAKLRAAERTDQPAPAPARSVLALAELPQPEPKRARR